jgi:caa(3)-type oxidase subunit IV
MASNVHLGIILGIIVASIIATVKGALVAGYFMHLFAERRLIYGVLALTAVFIVVMIGLPFTAINRAHITVCLLCRNNSPNRITPPKPEAEHVP